MSVCQPAVLDSGWGFEGTGMFSSDAQRAAHSFPRSPDYLSPAITRIINGSVINTSPQFLADHVVSAQTGGGDSVLSSEYSNGQYFWRAHSPVARPPDSNRAQKA